MNPAIRNQLAHLDRALLALLNERARLAGDPDADPAACAPAVDDLLRRNEGPLEARDLQAIFLAIGGASAAETGS